MTTRGKIVLTILVLGIVAFGMYRWWDKIAPKAQPDHVSMNVDDIKKAVQAAKTPPTEIPLLAGTNAAIQRSHIGMLDIGKMNPDNRKEARKPTIWVA